MLTVRFVNASVSWRAFRDPESDRWTAVCDALRLTADGETWEDLVSYSTEILSGVLTDLLAEGELQRFLVDQGWQPMITIPTEVPEQGIRWDIPLRMAQDRTYDQARAS